MASNYPGSLDSFDTIASDKKTSDAVGGRTHRQMHNDLGDAIESVQTELGTNPSGSESTVAARLTAIEDGTRLAANSVGATQLADTAVDTAAIADSAVTPAKLATTGRFVFPTGAANGYGFASGAVHLSGTGAPEGVITAAPGSTWLQTDSTVDVKGWIRWVKASGTGNTGWVAGPEANTGWRKIVTWDASGTITYGTATWGTNWTHATAGALYLRRAGDLIFMRMYFVKAAITNPGTPIFNEWTTLVPAAFRSSSPIAPFLGSGLTAYLPMNTGIMTSIAANSYTTDTEPIGQCYGVAWPTSMPGTAA